VRCHCEEEHTQSTSYDLHCTFLQSSNARSTGQSPQQDQEPDQNRISLRHDRTRNMTNFLRARLVGNPEVIVANGPPSHHRRLPWGCGHALQTALTERIRPSHPALTVGALESSFLVGPGALLRKVILLCSALVPPVARPIPHRSSRFSRSAFFCHSFFWALLQSNSCVRQLRVFCFPGSALTPLGSLP
jgi:hypothetical protein